jgi:rhomboid protease GluP
MTTTEGVSEVSGSKLAGAGSKPQLSAYPVITLLIAMNTTVFFLLPIAFEHDYPANPIRFGADWRPLSFSSEWWRLITSTFVHVELFHLLGNMAVLWILGKRVERLLGSLGVLAFYLGSAVLANIIVLFIHPTLVGYGASMPIVGLAGVLVVVYGKRFRLLTKRAKWNYGLLALFIAGLIRHEFAVTHRFAHTVGLLIGVSFALVFERVGRQRLSKYWASEEGS